MEVDETKSPGHPPGAVQALYQGDGLLFRNPQNLVRFSDEALKGAKGAKGVELPERHGDRDLWWLRDRTWREWDDGESARRGPGRRSRARAAGSRGGSRGSRGSDAACHLGPSG